MKCASCLFSGIVLTFTVVALLSDVTSTDRTMVVDNQLMLSESMTPTEQAYRICLKREMDRVDIISIDDMHVCAEETDYYVSE